MSELKHSQPSGLIDHTAPSKPAIFPDVFISFEANNIRRSSGTNHKHLYKRDRAGKRDKDHAIIKSTCRVEKDQLIL